MSDLTHQAKAVWQTVKRRLSLVGRRMHASVRQAGERIRTWTGRQAPVRRPPQRLAAADEAARQTRTTASLNQLIGQQARRKVRPIKRSSRQRVYRLQGYTTVSKINRRRQSEKRQRLLRELIIMIMLVVVLILLFQVFNPFKDMSEWYRIIGIDDLKDLAGQTSAP